MGRTALALTMLFTVGLAIGLFVLLPLFVAQGATSGLLSGWLTSLGITGGWVQFIQHLIEALIRIAIFVGYLLIVSRSAEINRVFRYHGAEHMTIHALEHDDPLTIAQIRRYPTAHPRCGTEFLVVFILVSILLFSLLAGQNLIISLLGRVLLIPVVAAVSYEVLRWGAKRRESWWVRWLFLPGIWLQSITTQPPDDSMIEIAIASMQEALAANGEQAPAGSLDPVREPVPDVHDLAKDMDTREKEAAAALLAATEAEARGGGVQAGTAAAEEPAGESR
jgi:uncharacterized protein YqhQ